MSKKTRSQVIKEYCLWCCADSRKEVKLCPVINCPLWVFRLGKEETKNHGFMKKDGTIDSRRLSRGSAIKERCANCSGWERGAVRNCSFDNCQLYPYRV